MTENAKIEYKLEVNLPELGSQDTMNVKINLDSKPGLSSIIGNFYRFLVRLGIEEELIDEYIIIPDLDSNDEDYDFEEAKGSMISEIEEAILANSTDEKKKEEFIQKMKDNPDFLEQVFQTFLSSILEEDEEDV